MTWDEAVAAKRIEIKSQGDLLEVKTIFKTFFHFRILYFVMFKLEEEMEILNSFDIF